MIDLVEEAKTYRTYALKRVFCDNRSDLEKSSLENKYYKQLNNHPNIGLHIYYSSLTNFREYFKHILFISLKSKASL